MNTFADHFEKEGIDPEELKRRLGGVQPGTEKTPGKEGAKKATGSVPTNEPKPAGAKGKTTPVYSVYTTGRTEQAQKPDAKIQIKPHYDNKLEAPPAPVVDGGYVNYEKVELEEHHKNDPQAEKNREKETRDSVNRFQSKKPHVNKNAVLDGLAQNKGFQSLQEKYEGLNFTEPYSKEKPSSSPDTLENMKMRSFPDLSAQCKRLAQKINDEKSPNEINYLKNLLEKTKKAFIERGGLIIGETLLYPGKRAGNGKYMISSVDSAKKSFTLREIAHKENVVEINEQDLTADGNIKSGALQKERKVVANEESGRERFDEKGTLIFNGALRTYRSTPEFLVIEEDTEKSLQKEIFTWETVTEKKLVPVAEQEDGDERRKEELKKWPPEFQGSGYVTFLDKEWGFRISPDGKMLDLTEVGNHANHTSLGREEASRLAPYSRNIQNTPSQKTAEAVKDQEMFNGLSPELKAYANQFPETGGDIIYQNKEYTFTKKGAGLHLKAVPGKGGIGSFLLSWEKAKSERIPAPHTNENPQAPEFLETEELLRQLSQAMEASNFEAFQATFNQIIEKAKESTNKEELQSFIQKILPSLEAIQQKIAERSKKRQEQIAKLEQEVSAKFAENLTASEWAKLLLEEQGKGIDVVKKYLNIIKEKATSSEQIRNVVVAFNDSPTRNFNISFQEVNGEQTFRVTPATAGKQTEMLEKIKEEEVEGTEETSTEAPKSPESLDPAIKAKVDSYLQEHKIPELQQGPFVQPDPAKFNEVGYTFGLASPDDNGNFGLFGTSENYTPAKTVYVGKITSPGVAEVWLEKNDEAVQRARIGYTMIIRPITEDANIYEAEAKEITTFVPAAIKYNADQKSWSTAKKMIVAYKGAGSDSFYNANGTITDEGYKQLYEEIEKRS